MIFSSTTASQYDACGSVSSTDGLIVRGEGWTETRETEGESGDVGLALPPFSSRETLVVRVTEARSLLLYRRRCLGKETKSHFNCYVILSTT
jgi:hypothetical protein